MHPSNDYTPEPPRRARQDNTLPRRLDQRLADDFVMGMRFFSRIPMGDRPHERPNLDRIAPALPLISLAISLLPALLLMGACWLGIPHYFAAALGVAALLVVTGAMTEDALADAADGLFGGADADRRLEIMKDSRHGTYGVCAIGLFVLLRVLGFGAMAVINPLAAGGVWLATTIIGRSASLWVSVDLPPAREGGASASVGRVTRNSFAIASIFVLLLSFVLAGPFVGILGLIASLLAAVATILGWTWCCRQLIGGQTGDLIGAAQALVEFAVLTAFLIFVNA